MDPEVVDYICPNCSQTVQVTPSDEAQLYSCPACGNEFVVAGADGSTELSESTKDQAHDDRSDKLDNIRIRQLSQVKRATNRARSIGLIVVLFCAVAAIQVGINVVRDVWTGQNSWKTGLYCLIVALLAWVGVSLWRKTRQLRAESGSSSILPPEKPPDFSNLDDGSRRWKELEDG
jgi:predicted RNA-binding Zn-ribbon protein involved in translation (DUF1610 family)